MKIYEICVVGAGASGLMFASLAANRFDIIIIDSNKILAPKLKISGGGKCNITNVYCSVENYFCDSKFIEPALLNFSNKDLIDFCNFNGVDTSEIKRVVDGQIFCRNSSFLIEMLGEKISNALLLNSTRVLSVVKLGNVFEIDLGSSKVVAKNLVVASGGVSYPELNASSIGYEIAKKFGHKIIPATPALVGFTVQSDEFWFKSLSGISIDAKMQIGKKSFEGGLLFAHKGISGPVVLNSSLWWQKGKISINFCPKIKNLYAHLQKNKDKNISNAMNLPKNFMKAFLNKIKLDDKKIAELQQLELEKISIIQKYEFSPAGTFGFSKAEVTRGGICTDEVDPFTMMSKLEPNLYFLGEVLDVTGELGGYNLQWAFSSAKICFDNFGK